MESATLASLSAAASGATGGRGGGGGGGVGGGRRRRRHEGQGGGGRRAYFIGCARCCGSSALRLLLQAAYAGIAGIAGIAGSICGRQHTPVAEAKPVGKRVRLKSFHFACTTVDTRKARFTCGRGSACTRGVWVRGGAAGQGGVQVIVHAARDGKPSGAEESDELERSMASQGASERERPDTASEHGYDTALLRRARVRVLSPGPAPSAHCPGGGVHTAR